MSSTEKEIKPKKHHKARLENILIFVGLLTLAGGLILLTLTFLPVVRQELMYRLDSQTKSIQKEIVPVDKSFGIVIPKISANARVIANVDPLKEDVYQRALTKGVAHAQGTVLPGETGNMFIFAHSAGNWYEANQYNAVFYLLYKLIKGDVINIYYKDKLYVYKVREIKYIESTEVSYLSSKTDGWKTLTLMTCWPPGTTLKRLIVVADIVE